MFVSYSDFAYNKIYKSFLVFEKLNLAINENSYEIEWDLTNDIKHDISLIKKINLGKDKLIKYFYSVLDKLIQLPDYIKTKLFKSLILTLLASFSYQELNMAIDTYFNSNNSELATIRDSKKILSTLKTELKNIEQSNKKIIEYTRPTEFSDTLVKFLQFEEGDIKDKGKPVLTAYDIGDGMITIGYGHAERKGHTDMKKGVTTISEDQALDLLIEDIKEAQKGLDRILDDWDSKGVKIKINQGMYDAMISMIYNMGIGNFRISNFIQLIKQNKFEQAKEAIKSTNVTYPGHVIRRKKESLLFSSEDPSKIENQLLN